MLGAVEPCLEGELLQVHQRDAQRHRGLEPHSGLKFLAAVNGACAGGGYELALACDEIILVDDARRPCRLPEVPLLGVLPGTGGLTRVTDKRQVRHDLADIFCTTTEGVRGERAKEWRLVDAIAKPQQFATHRAGARAALAAQSDRPAGAKGVALTPLERTIDADGFDYAHVDVAIDRAARTATITVQGARDRAAAGHRRDRGRGADWWPLAMARELDDAILTLRTNELDIGIWLIKTEGEPQAVLGVDATLDASTRTHWLVRETIGLLRRTFAGSTSPRARCSRSSSGLVLRRHAARARARLRPHLHAGAAGRGRARADRCARRRSTSALYPMVSGQSRLARRFYDEAAALDAARARHRQAARRRGRVRARPRHRRARRHRLGRRDPHRGRGARRACRPTR